MRRIPRVTGFVQALSVPCADLFSISVNVVPKSTHEPAHINFDVLLLREPEHELKVMPFALRRLITPLCRNEPPLLVPFHTRAGCSSHAQQLSRHSLLTSIDYGT